ncbi:hypothetical protein [Pseudofrankia sp. BMG5.36]|uniref:hypothetical protein n=2 Tax=unclassified Pseudofrankia TaxID=2994372 RepID=UPI00104210E5|nr:hypothetical protein [Pseudofrankia sp. BMG5.36]
MLVVNRTDRILAGLRPAAHPRGRGRRARTTAHPTARALLHSQDSKDHLPSADARPNLLTVLDLLRRSRGSASLADTLGEPPGWLRDAFTPPPTDDEAGARLAHRRTTLHETKAALESQLDWDFDEWTNWFSNQNDSLEIRSARPLPADMVELLVKHVDDPFATQPIEWLTGFAGFEIATAVLE